MLSTQGRGLILFSPRPTNEVFPRALIRLDMLRLARIRLELDNYPSRTIIALVPSNKSVE